MNINNDLSFNYAERSQLLVNKEITFPNFNESSMRIASVLGGGISGVGEICGAFSGGIICLGQIESTVGTERPEEFHQKRRVNRELTQSWKTGVRYAVQNY